MSRENSEVCNYLGYSFVHFDAIRTDFYSLARKSSQKCEMQSTFEMLGFLVFLSSFFASKTCGEFTATRDGAQTTRERTTMILTSYE